MNKLRYGIIGCGSMGREHIENIRAMGGGVVTAVADLERAARALHTAFGLDSGQAYSAPLPERK